MFAFLRLFVKAVVVVLVTGSSSRKGFTFQAAFQLTFLAFSALVQIVIVVFITVSACLKIIAVQTTLNGITTSKASTVLEINIVRFVAFNAGCQVGAVQAVLNVTRDTLFS